MKFSVIRQHLGDRMYMPGEEREANKSDVQHLLDAGVLAEHEGAKAEDGAPRNKAHGRAPKNKGE